MKHRALALVGLLSVAALGHAREDERPPLTVFFTDGSSQPLGGWAFSYEYASWRKGETPAQGSLARKESTELIIGKKVVPVAGLVLEVEYTGATARAIVAVDKDGKRNPLKTEAPAPDVLLPQTGKDMVMQVRGLDLQGETLTGSKRSYCLLSFTALVECAPDPDQRIVKIRFP